MRRLLLCLLLGSLPISEALADCVMLEEPKPFTTHIMQAYAPVVDGLGDQQPGCIVETSDGQKAYVSYDYICRLSKNESIELKPSYGCCDTGPDSGDLTCTVRVKRLGGLEVIRAGGLGLSPTKTDPQAIKDLMAVFKGNYNFREHGAALKLVEYVQNPLYTKQTEALRDELAGIVDNEKLHINQRGYAAYVLLHYPNVSDDEFAKRLVTFLKMEPIFAPITAPLIKKASTLSNQGGIFAPQLLYYLKRRSTDKEIVPVILDALEKLAPTLRPHMKEILQFEYEWSDRGNYYDFEERNSYWNRMQNIACKISKNDVSGVSRDQFKQSKQPFTCSKNQ